MFTDVRHDLRLRRFENSYHIHPPIYTQPMQSTYLPTPQIPAATYSVLTCERRHRHCIYLLFVTQNSFYGNQKTINI